jgi:hypothetical protein
MFDTSPKRTGQLRVRQFDFGRKGTRSQSEGSEYRHPRRIDGQRGHKLPNPRAVARLVSTGSPWQSLIPTCRFSDGAQRRPLQRSR